MVITGSIAIIPRDGQYRRAGPGSPLGKQFGIAGDLAAGQGPELRAQVAEIGPCPDGQPEDVACRQQQLHLPGGRHYPRLRAA
jgi:hypothetical protein